MISGTAFVVTVVIASSVWFISRPDSTTFDPAGIAASIPAPTTTTTAPPTELDVIRAAKTAIWKVETSGCDHEGNGTAWALDERHLVTNGHVVDTDSNPTLRSPDGDTLQARVIGRSMEPDLAVLAVEQRLPHHLDWASTTALEEGQRLIALGFPAPGAEFATHPGTLVSFQVEDGTRVALRTDAAVDRGNSGGPMITAEGEVAGVVTRMADNEDGFQNVPLAFTADSLRVHTDLMIAAPSTPEPDCSRIDLIAGLPDEPAHDWEFEPWENWELPEPEPYIPPTFPEYTTTTVPCPTGQPSAEISSVDVRHAYDSYDGTGSYDVTVVGRVTNNASATVYVSTVEVMIDGDDYSSYGITDVNALRPGESTRFEASSYVFNVRHAPSTATIQDFDWDWDHYDHYGCSTR